MSSYVLEIIIDWMMNHAKHELSSFREICDGTKLPINDVKSALDYGLRYNLISCIQGLYCV